MKLKLEQYYLEHTPHYPRVKLESELQHPCQPDLQLRCLELLDYIPLHKQTYELNPPEIIEVLIPRKVEPNVRKQKKHKPWSHKKRAKLSKKKNLISGNYRVIEVPKTSGKKPRVEKRWQLLCNHCKVLFLARPTPKNSRYVVNHQCQPDGIRRQYIIGVKGRNCVLPHESACIQHVECFGDE